MTKENQNPNVSNKENSLDNSLTLSSVSDSELELELKPKKRVSKVRRNLLDLMSPCSTEKTLRQDPKLLPSTEDQKKRQPKRFTFSTDDIKRSERTPDLPPPYAHEAYQHLRPNFSALLKKREELRKDPEIAKEIRSRWLMINEKELRKNRATLSNEQRDSMIKRINSTLDSIHLKNGLELFSPRNHLNNRDIIKREEAPSNILRPRNH